MMTPNECITRLRQEMQIIGDRMPEHRLQDVDRLRKGKQLLFGFDRRERERRIRQGFDSSRVRGSPTDKLSKGKANIN